MNVFRFYLLLLIVTAFLTGCSASQKTVDSEQVTKDLSIPIPDSLLANIKNGKDITMPELIGGLRSVQNRAKYPKHLRKEGVQGKVFIQFVVDEEGYVRNKEVARSLHPELDQIALDAIAQARFNPGLQNGAPVPIKMSMPIYFGTR